MSLIIGLFFTQTYKVFLKTSPPHRRRTKALEFFEVLFHRLDKVVYIFSDKDLHDQVSSRFQKLVGKIQNSEVEFDTRILVDVLVASGLRRNV